MDMMHKILSQLTSIWNTSAKEQPMLTVQQGTGQHFLLSIDSTELAFHSVTYDKDMPQKQSIVLDGYTLYELIETINGLGYVATLSDIAASQGYGVKKASLLMPVSNIMIVNPYTLSGFTSKLWQTLYPIARILEEDDLNTNEAVMQAYLNLTSGDFMDYWGTFFNIQRLAGESDLQMQKRIFMAITNMKTNNLALEKLVEFTINGDAQVVDTAPAQFKIMIDPDFMATADYVKDMITSVKGGGIDFFLEYLRNLTEDYKANFKAVHGVEFATSAAAAFILAGAGLSEDFSASDPTGDVCFTLNQSILNGSAGLSILTDRVRASGSMTFTKNGVVMQTTTL